MKSRTSSVREELRLVSVKNASPDLPRSLPTQRMLDCKTPPPLVTARAEGVHGVMVAARGDGVEAVPLEAVAGQRKLVPLDHPWIESARRVGTCLGD